MGNKDTDSLTHTTWECKYHIVFAPKYRRQVIYKDIKKDIGVILRKLCEYKGIEIVEAQLMPDHVHMLVKSTAEIQCVTNHGIPEREEQHYDI